MERYSINVAWSDEDEAFIATCPEFPGLSAFGETREESIGEAEVALEGFIEVLQGEGKAFPAPELVRSYSGRFLTRVPKMLHARLAKLAEREGVSLNSLVQCYLSECAGGAEVLRADTVKTRSRQNSGRLARGRRHK